MPIPSQAVVRLLDASLNRASEGARVVEDYARFVLGDAHLSQLAKRLRHGIVEVGSELPVEARLVARDTPGDVGTTITTDSETDRADAWAVCLASSGRLQEALRSLEEYGKTLSPETGVRFERLRYDAYTLAKGLGSTRRGRERLDTARLYVLIDGCSSADSFELTVRSICQAGADLLQLRDKRLEDRELVDRAKRLAAICREHGTLSIVNDRADIALVADADGVHVGQEEISVADCRRVVGPEKLVGLSTHSIDQARSGVLAGADYLGVGPTFPTPTKRFDAFPGLGFVREVAAEVTLPSFAIGGITQSNLPQVLASGATRVAVSSAVTAADDPVEATRSLKQMLADSVGSSEPNG